MGNTLDINVKHVTRIEGHGNIRVRASDGTVEEVKWIVPEAPRFFEAMVRGRSYQDIQTVACRICGICSVTHTLAAIKAIEDAMNLEVSEQTRLLRILAHYGEQIESHALHVGYLVAPDLLAQKSVVPLTQTHTDAVVNIIALHKLGNKMMEVIAGRKTHPMRLQPGRMTMIPKPSELRQLKKELEDARGPMKVLADTVLSLAGGIPAFNRDTEYIALVNPPKYAFFDGHIGSTDTDERVPVQEFERVVNEYVSPQSTAKWCKWHRDSYAVGALARYNLNAEHLLPAAKEAAAAFGLEKGACNPYLNNVAQVVETVQCIERSVEIIDEILTDGLTAERPKIEPKAGEGAGGVEAPRGVLFHRYEFDKNGICQRANLCIPTNQNHANIQKDFESLVPQIIDQGQDNVRLLLEMLVRSYDPCVSCSTHFLDVEFV